MSPIDLVVYFSIGLFAGFMSGMFGIGGGSVRIPLLNIAGLPLLNAFGINLFVIPFSSSVGAISHRKNLDRKIAGYVIIGGTAGSVVGAFFVGVIPTLTLAIIFVVVSVITVFGIYLERIAPKIAQRINPDPKSITTGAFFLNLITGIRGGSGGSLYPSFLKTMGLDIRRAIATSLFVTIFAASAALVVYWNRGDILWLPALSVLIGSMLGARVGSHISLKAKSVWLEIGLAMLVIVLALSVLCKTLMM